MKASKNPRAILLVAIPKNVVEKAVVRDVRLQRMAATPSSTLLDVLSASMPVNKTVTEKKTVNTAPESKPNFV